MNTKLKIKTKKSVLKRIKIKKNCLEYKKAFKGHLLRKKNSKRLRKLSNKSSINKFDVKNILRMLPNK